LQSDPQNSEPNQQSAEENQISPLALRKIRRARTRLLVCFWTLPVYVVAIWVLLNNGRGIDTLMWLYMGFYAIFAVDMAFRECPRCGEQFYVKTILLNLITSECTHCGISNKANSSELT
jgi:hypothetical protein